MTPDAGALALDELHLLGVALGAGVGSMVRALVDRSITARVGLTRLPWATLAVNVVGSFVLGVVLGWTAGSLVGSDAEAAHTMRLVIGTGFCGGLTTFSTFTVESWALLREGRPRGALAYAALTMALGMAAVVLGTALGTALR
jgi:fluoride exporter